jgi:hypothetical protein
MKLSKTILLASLFVITTSAFADHAVVSFAGKKVTVEDTRASLIKKLGKPAYGDNKYSSWTINGLSIYANYSPYGLKSFGINQDKPTPVTVNIDGKIITLGKDSLASTVSKLKHGCYGSMFGRQASTYQFAVSSGAEGEYQVIFETISDGNNEKEIRKEPITGVSLDYDEFDANGGCTQ